MAVDKIIDEAIIADIIVLLAENESRWWIDHGTLLGYVRNGAPLSWDKDFDVGTDRDIDFIISQIYPIFKKKYPQCYIDSLSDSLKIPFKSQSGSVWSFDLATYKMKNGVAVKYWPDISSASLPQKILSVALTRLSGRSAIQTDSTSVRLICYALEPIAWFLTCALSIKQRHQVFRCLAKYVPRKENKVSSKYFVDISEFAFAEMKLNVPSYPFEYLAVRYGPDWRMEKKEWDYLKDDGGLP